MPRSLWEIGAAIKPIVRHVHSGLFLLAAAAENGGIQPNGKPAMRDLLGWAVLNTWRTSLLREAEVAPTVSQETSLLLVKMPAIRRILGLVREHRRLARHYKAESYPGRIILFRAGLPLNRFGFGTRPDLKQLFLAITAIVLLRLFALGIEPLIEELLGSPRNLERFSGLTLLAMWS